MPLRTPRISPLPPRRALPRHTVVLAAYALAVPLGPGACGSVADPLPPGAVRFAPPPAYARWWAMTEACAGISGDFAAYAWYVTPGAQVPVVDEPGVLAYADVEARRIVLAASWTTNGLVVRHEMLHALLGPAYATGGFVREHPPAYFQGRCAGVVACYPVGCADAGPAPVTAPADAPTLPMSALDIGLDLVATPLSRTSSDSVLSLVVRVTNPSAGPVWVPLEPSADLRAPWDYWFGFRIIPTGSDSVVLGVVNQVNQDSVPRVPFAAGQTRRYVFDVNAARFAAGDYVAVGIFNTRQVTRPLRVLP